MLHTACYAVLVVSECEYRVVTSVESVDTVQRGNLRFPKLECQALDLSRTLLTEY